MLALSVAIEVRQKVSAFWSFASLGVAVAAVLVGTGIALRSSVIITPSLLRKWTGEKRVSENSGKLEFVMPIRLHEEAVGALFSYLRQSIPNHILGAYPGSRLDFIEKRAVETEVTGPEFGSKTLTFNYFFGHSDFIGSSPFSLVAEKKKDETTYTLKLSCNSDDKETVERKVTFIRMMIVDWDAQRK